MSNPHLPAPLRGIVPPLITPLRDRDTLDARGGTFYVMTEENPAVSGSEQRMSLQRERKGELVLQHGMGALRIPCRVRGISFDPDGLYMYVGVDFLLDSDGDRRRLNDLFGMLW